MCLYMVILIVICRWKLKLCFECFILVSDLGFGLVIVVGGEDENEVDDVIGIEDLEKVWVEVDVCEEEYCKVCKEKVEWYCVMFEVYC